MPNELLYQGKAKSVYSTDEEHVLRLVYLDQATALNGKKKDEIVGKGELNNQITSLIFDYLTEKNIKHHFISQLSKNEQLVEALEIIPLEVVVRNISAGSFAKRLGVSEGKYLEKPIIEFYLKDDVLDDPFINDEHVSCLQLASAVEVSLIKQMALEINQELQTLFKSCQLTLVDFKLEFGHLSSGEIVLADEITPDTCRLWCMNTQESLDKDIYRKDLGDIIPIYQDVLNRLQQVKENGYV